MTADDPKKNQNQETKEYPDLTELWKKLYFQNEGAMAKAVEEYVAGQSFTDLLEQFGNQYLSMYKAATHNMDRIFTNNPMPSKKDIARVCELVLAVEEKVENLDSDMASNMGGLASSLIRLVDFQVVLKDELIAMRQEVQSLQNQLQQMQAKSAGSAVAGAAGNDSGGQIESVKPQEPKKAPRKPAQPRARKKAAEKE